MKTISILLILISALYAQDALMHVSGIVYIGEFEKISSDKIHFRAEGDIYASPVPKSMIKIVMLNDGTIIYKDETMNYADLDKVRNLIKNHNLIEQNETIDENEKRRQRELGIAAAKKDYHGITWGVCGFLTAAGTGVIGAIAIGTYFMNAEPNALPIAQIAIFPVGGIATSIVGIALLRYAAHKSKVDVPSHYTQSISNEKALEFRKGYEDQMKKYRGRQVVTGGIIGTCTSIPAGLVLLIILL